ncbi:hypothetical protein ACFL6N_02165 [Thermodesulfobacteriota bacterium]
MSIFRITALFLVLFTSVRVALLLPDLRQQESGTAMLEMEAPLHLTGTTQHPFIIQTSGPYHIDILFSDPNDPGEKLLGRQQQLIDSMDLAWRIHKEGTILAQGASWEQTFDVNDQRVRMGSFHAVPGNNYLLELKNYRKLPELESGSPRIMVMPQSTGHQDIKERINPAITALLLSLTVLAYAVIRDRKYTKSLP